MAAPQEAARLMAEGRYESALPAALDALRKGDALFAAGPRLQMFPLYLLAAQANLGLRWRGGLGGTSLRGGGDTFKSVRMHGCMHAEELALQCLRWNAGYKRQVLREEYARVRQRATSCACIHCCLPGASSSAARRCSRRACWRCRSRPSRPT